MEWSALPMCGKSLYAKQPTFAMLVYCSEKPIIIMEQCFLCAENFVCAKMAEIVVGQFDTDMVFFCSECFLVAPWRELENESNVEFFIRATSVPDAQQRPLSHFPNRLKCNNPYQVVWTRAISASAVGQK